MKRLEFIIDRNVQLCELMARDIKPFSLQNLMDSVIIWQKMISSKELKAFWKNMEQEVFLENGDNILITLGMETYLASKFVMRAARMGNEDAVETWIKVIYQLEEEQFLNHARPVFHTNGMVRVERFISYKNWLVKQEFEDG